MITKAGKKRAGYPMDFIPDKELFKAVMFAIAFVALIAASWSFAGLLAGLL